MIVRGTQRYRIACLVVLGVIALLFIALPFTLTPFRVFQISQVLVLAVAVLGLNLLTGYNGQISLGHSAFFAVGAYTSAILTTRIDGFPYLLTLPVAAAITFVFGYLFGIPALRLKGLYLALVTIALAVVAVPLIKRFESLSGGVQGIVATQPPPRFGLAQDQYLYFVCLAVMALMFLLAWNLVRGRVGRSMIAVRDNEIAAETMGVNVAQTKTLTFAYSAMFAGVAGALYTFIVGFVSPESFTLTVGIGFLAGLVLGGAATIGGSLLGAFFVQFVPLFANEIKRPALTGLIYGGALVLFMLVLPGGLMGLLRRITNRFIDLRGAHSGPGAPAHNSADPAFVGQSVTDAAHGEPAAVEAQGQTQARP